MLNYQRMKINPSNLLNVNYNNYTNPNLDNQKIYRRKPRQTRKKWKRQMKMEVNLIDAKIC